MLAGILVAVGGFLYFPPWLLTTLLCCGLVAGYLSLQSSMNLASVLRIFGWVPATEGGMLDVTEVPNVRRTLSSRQNSLGVIAQGSIKLCLLWKEMLDVMGFPSLAL